MKRAQGTTLCGISVSNLVRSLLSGTNDYEETEALLKRIRRGLNDPMLIERIPFLSDTHPLKREAIAVSDAFEAATNGMDNAEAFERLEPIEKNSIFYPWKMLITGIRAFYMNDGALMEESLESIPHDAPPAVLVPLLFEMADSGSRTDRRPDEKSRLERGIVQENSLLSSCIDQIREALSSGMEDIYTETVMLVIRDIIRTDREPAERFILWSLQAAAEHDISPAELISRLKTVLPQSEVYRLTALSMLRTDPDIALLFWIRFMLSKLHAREISLLETETALEILEDIGSGAAQILERENDREISYAENLDGLLRTLVQELSSAFPETFRRATVYRPGSPFVVIGDLTRFIRGAGDTRKEEHQIRRRNGSAGEAFDHRRSANESVTEAEPERGAQLKKRIGRSEKRPAQLELFV